MESKCFITNNNTIIENTGFSDVFSLHRIDKYGNWGKPKVETNNNPNVLQRILCKLGILNYAGDALTNYALGDLSTYLSTKYLYCSVGIDGTSSTDYTLTDLKSPVMARVATTNTVTTTYTTNDTVQFTAIITCDGDYTLAEAGLHTTLTSGSMGARQTYYNWAVTNGETIGAIWKIINNRS